MITDSHSTFFKSFYLNLCNPFSLLINTVQMLHTFSSLINVPFKGLPISKSVVRTLRMKI